MFANSQPQVAPYTIAPGRPVTDLAIRQATSFASLPEFANSTRSNPAARGIDASNRSASSTAASWTYRVFVFRRRVCSAMASTARGWPWPTTGTLLYASR